MEKYKKTVLRIDVIIQKIFLYWIALGISTAAITGLLHWTSFLSKTIIEFLGTSAYWIIILLFVFLPVLALFNLIANLFHFKYGSYSDKIKFFRKIYTTAILIFVVFVGIGFVAYFGFSYLIIDASISSVLFLLLGGLFALAHCYITLLENKIRKDLECYNK